MFKTKEAFLDKTKNGIPDGIKTLKFTGIHLSTEFLMVFYKAVNRKFDKIIFNDGNSEDGTTFAEILDGCNVTSLSITNCKGVTVDDLEEILYRLATCCTININFSGNTNPKGEQLDEEILKSLASKASDSLGLKIVYQSKQTAKERL